MLQVSAGPYRIRGVSVGGVYTSMHVPELNALFDLGMPQRSCAAAKRWFLSHGHCDHAGALISMLGIRNLFSSKMPPQVFAPAELVPDLLASLTAARALPRHALEIRAIPMADGEAQPLQPDLWVRAFRTHHRVPSLGYQFFRRVQKLRPEFRHLEGQEIARLRNDGADLFDSIERLELAYATDTLVQVLDSCPSLLRTRVLILECTFLDERKSRATSVAGGHIHLDDLLERADQFENEAIVLMHFSQTYHPSEVHRILARRCPARLRNKLVVFAPQEGPWPG